MSFADELQILKFKTGSQIVTQGQKADKAYMILSGEVRVFLEKDGKIVELARLGEDQIFGESAIFSGKPYGAHVETTKDTELYVITKESMHRMLQDSDPIIRALIHMLSERLQATNDALLKSETREFIDVVMI